MTNPELWQAALGELELLVSKANFTTWFRNTFIISCENDQMVIGVPNAFTKAWLENKYHSYILTALQRLTSQQIKDVKYQVTAVVAPQQVTEGTPGAAATREVALPPASEPLAALTKNGLNPRYTFDRFIVGKTSELAHAACRAVSANPGQTYNPLFLYGGVGLGKTHLIQAIGNEVLENRPNLKVVFTSCERFTNDFVQSIRDGKIDHFKKTYRDVDLLLVDDVQFLTNKEQTQEEFFHTFNTLHQNNKQIILTSDRPPKAIPAIESRLVSRFEWGMIADVGKPDYETRVAILQARAQERGFPLNPETIQYIAQVVANNVRELEGALTRLFAYYQLNKVIPSVDLTKSLLGSLQQESSNYGGLTPKRILAAVSSYFDISLENLVGHSRRRELVVPRQITMFLLREECSSSFPAIGQELGGRDHTTAMHACTKIKNLIVINSRLRTDVEQIKIRLGGAGA